MTEWDQDRAPHHYEVVWQRVPKVIGQSMWGALISSPHFTTYAVAGGSIMCTSTQTWAGTAVAPFIHCETPHGETETTYRVAVDVILPEDDDE